MKFFCFRYLYFVLLIKIYTRSEFDRQYNQNLNVDHFLTTTYAVGMGMALEAVQVLIIFITAKPFELAWELVQFIRFPMILGNGFGTLLFIIIVQAIKREEERARVDQTNQAFEIADQTLLFFRQGLNFQSCREIADIILKLTNADAVTVTDDHQVLAHVGSASDHHLPKLKPETGLTKRVLESRRISIARTRAEISCLQKMAL